MSYLGYTKPLFDQQYISVTVNKTVIIQHDIPILIR